MGSDKQDIHVKHVVQANGVGDGGLPHSGSTEVAHIEDVAGIEAYREVGSTLILKGDANKEGLERSPFAPVSCSPVLDTKLDWVKLQAEKHSRKGEGRPCKVVLPSSTSAYISLSDSCLRSRKEAILKDAASTVGFGVWSLEEQSCCMIVAYAPCETGAQVELWRRLIVVLALLALPVCCGGDFNAGLTLEERRNCTGEGEGG
ncbi:hypothetical protein V6N13_042859 [Hibiscus sabdariffa]